ncbi:hypothetical protein SDC9_211658 [bioreactor metagenome]|uniref:Uncharacterized protein n=1 Tax=bioreactor metagenome TaxID=1076179 RepID=A0A645JJY1_9ZZZZ
MIFDFIAGVKIQPRSPADGQIFVENILQHVIVGEKPALDLGGDRKEQFVAGNESAELFEQVLGLRRIDQAAGAVGGKQAQFPGPEEGFDITQRHPYRQHRAAAALPAAEIIQKFRQRIGQPGRVDFGVAGIDQLKYRSRGQRHGAPMI